MKSFLSRFHALVLFTLSGFDRLRFRGESRLLNHSRGVESYCYQRRILFKDFPEHAEALTKTLRSETAKNQGDVPRVELVIANGRRLARPLNALTGADGKLLRTLADGDYLINGFRNRDLRLALLGSCDDATERRRQSAKVTRWLAILKAHGMILKVQKTHRYQLTAYGRRVVTALLAAHTADTQKLMAARGRDLTAVGQRLLALCAGRLVRARGQAASSRASLSGALRGRFRHRLCL
jgi:hypothetical protein